MSLLVTFIEGPTPVHERAAAHARALAAAQDQGFHSPQRLEWPGGHALWFSTPQQPRSSGACVQDGPRFAALCGTAHWQGLAGEPLLQRLLKDFARPQDMPLRDLSGGFALLFSQGDAVWLFNDAVGLQKIYTAPEQGVISTSWLVCRAALPQARIHRLRAQEYVLLGSTHATQTPVQGVQALDPAALKELRSNRDTPLHAAQAWRSPTHFQSEAEATATLSDLIASEFGGMLKAFGAPVGMALSGGFDSRLLLAALQHQGVAPRLYVYGSDSLDDVRVARAKAQELGISIECIDKAQLNGRLPPLDRAQLKANLAFFDGLPVDGIFDRGADRQTRLQQMSAGTLNLNGGGGEILRNFFYLPDRRYCASDLVSTFYSNWLPAAIANADERHAFQAATADGILHELGLPAGSARARQQPLSRSDVELVYTLFRLRWWMARNNTVATRHGAFMTPLVQPRLVELAAQVPVAWKTYGQMEAAIITRLSPAGASGPSNYGFDFSQGPGAAHRRSVNATLWRPIAVRRASARLRRLLGRNPTVAAPAEWLQALPLPQVDWLDTRFLTSTAQWNRLLTLCAATDDTLAHTAS